MLMYAMNLNSYPSFLSNFVVSRLDISLDAVDVSGESLLDVQSDISMQRLSRRGVPISVAEAGMQQNRTRK